MRTLIVKDPDENDLATIDYLNKQQADFKLDNLDNRIIHRLMFDGTVPVAYGIVKRMAEAVILVNPNTSKILRTVAMMELMRYAEFGSKEADCKQLHCFVSDPNLARTLERQYDFIRTKDIVLVKNL